MITETTKYEIKCYHTAKQVGTAVMTAEQYSRYTSESDRDTGVLALGDLMDIAGTTLIDEDQDISITVYCE